MGNQLGKWQVGGITHERPKKTTSPKAFKRPVCLVVKTLTRHRAGGRPQKNGAARTARETSVEASPVGRLENNYGENGEL